MPTKVKIDFLVAGFSKCGTTTLCAALARHPDIFIPEVKEPRYFSSTDFESGHAWYDQLFTTAATNQKKGEGSPSYSSASREDDSLARIYANNPECRFIFIARHPARRIESSYREMHHSGVRFGLNAPFSLGECLDTFPEMLNDTLFEARIEKYIAKFGEQAVHVVFLEELTDDMFAQLNACYRHIGVAPERLTVQQDIRLNSGTAKLYDSALLRRLRGDRFFGPKIAKLSPSRQDALFSRLGMRRPFGQSSVSWDECAIRHYQDRVVPDAKKFLQRCNRPADFWQLDIRTGHDRT